MKALMSSKFGQIPTPELSALKRLKNLMYNIVNTLTPSFFDWIFFIFAGNNDNYKVSDEFEIRSDPTIDCGVSCP